MRTAVPTRDATRVPVLITSVIDGDTYSGSWLHGLVTIRIRGFDAPEIGQALGGWVAALVRRLLSGRIVACESIGIDRYNRIVMDLSWQAGGRVAVTLLEAGLGHVDMRYARPLHVYRAAEARARERGIGIWGEAAVVAPWVFRGHRPNPWLTRRSGCHYRFRR